MTEAASEPEPLPDKTLVVRFDYTEAVFLVSEIDACSEGHTPTLTALRDRLAGLVSENPRGVAWLDKHDRRRG